MNCTEWEERIALCAGEDLDAPGAAAVERHLRECPGCQLFASGLAESLECVKAAHAGDIAAGHYTALRARVLAAVGRERQRQWRGWAYAAAAAIAAAAVLLAAPRWKVPELRSPSVQISPPAGWATIAAPHPLRTHPPSAGRSPARQRREQVLVKVETDNPDVVILWIAETTGDN
jgi:hypothetical protein